MKIAGSNPAGGINEVSRRTGVQAASLCSSEENDVSARRPSAEALIAHLGLSPLEGEGGWFRETYRLERPGSPTGNRATAIYYLLTPEIFSELHRLPGDEIYHFYLGDPVELLQLGPDGEVRRDVLGTDVLGGMSVQLVVPGGAWQGSRLRDGGQAALMGTTMTPGFDPDTYERGVREDLLRDYPGAAREIALLTRD